MDDDKKQQKYTFCIEVDRKPYQCERTVTGTAADQSVTVRGVGTESDPADYGSSTSRHLNGRDRDLDCHANCAEECCYAPFRRTLTRITRTLSGVFSLSVPQLLQFSHQPFAPRSLIERRLRR